jgi:hypothetical protein
VNVIEELLGRKKAAVLVYKDENTAVGIHCADHARPLSAKVCSNFATSGGRSVVVYRSRTEATEFALVLSGYSDAGLGSVPFARRHWTDPFRR